MAAPYERLAGRGCPCCSGQKVSITNCLATIRPRIAEEWHPAKNGDLTPYDVTAFSSNVKAFWQCRSGDPTHEWPAIVSNRSKGRGCPFCRLVGRSRPQIMLAFELAAFLPIDLFTTKLDIGERVVSVDICDPHHRLVVEYDGNYWHRGSEERDAKKTSDLESAGWTVVRVREVPLQPISRHTVATRVEQPAHRTAAAVLGLIQSLGIPVGDLDRYIAENIPVGAHEAEAYLDALLSDQRID